MDLFQIFGFFFTSWQGFLVFLCLLLFGQVCLWYYTDFRWKDWFAWLKFPKEIKALGWKRVYRLQNPLPFFLRDLWTSRREDWEDDGLKSSVGLFWRYLSLPAATLHLFHLKRIEGPAAEIHYGSIKGQHLKGFRFLLDKIEDFASHWKDLEEGRIPVILSPLFPHQALTLLGQFPLTEPQLQDLGASTGGINWKALARGLLKNEGIRLLIDYSRAGVDWVGEDFLYAWDVLNLLQRRRVLEHISRGFLKHPEAKKLFWQRMNRDQMYNSDYTSPELLEWLEEHPHLICPDLWSRLSLGVVRGIWRGLSFEQKMDLEHQQAFWKTHQVSPASLDLGEEIRQWPQLLSLFHFPMIPQAFRLQALNYAGRNPEEYRHSHTFWAFLIREIELSPKSFDQVLDWLALHPNFLLDQYLRRDYLYQNTHLTGKFLTLIRLRPNRENLEYMERWSENQEVKDFLPGFRNLVTSIQGGLSISRGRGGDLSPADKPVHP